MELRVSQIGNSLGVILPKRSSPSYVSAKETRRCIEQAQARLDLFAAKPEYRSAYEREVLEMMEHNTQLENSFEEEREER